MEEISKERLEKMLRKIITIEKEYARTNEGSENDMINKIKKIIEEEAECY